MMMRRGVLLCLLITLTLSAVTRPSLYGEISPASAEQSSGSFFNLAIDEDWQTCSKSEKDKNDATWLKLKLGQVYCIDMVLVFGAKEQKDGKYEINSCSQADDACTTACRQHDGKSGTMPCTYRVEVSLEDTISTADIPSATAGCKLGDTVILSENKPVYSSYMEICDVFITAIGVKSGVATYPGETFESDEAGSIKFEVYKGAWGITTATVSMTKEGQGGVVDGLPFVKGTEVGNLVPYTYTIQDSMKMTGTYQMKVTYQRADGAGDTVRISTMDLHLPVYQFCKIDELPTVAGGTWSPAPKVDFRGYATLMCESGKYRKGEGITQCLPGSTKTAFAPLDPAPTCESKADLVCGALIEPEHGSVIYKDASTASYRCDAGYSLIGASAEHTCDSSTGIWSIVTAENPNGNRPACQEFCKIDELPTVTGGTWSPAPKVDFRGYATLTCESGKYRKGEGIAQCLSGSTKTAFAPLDPAPTCESEADLVCGPLPEPGHGSVIYKDASTASYRCDAGYSLIGAAAEYTCDASTFYWSIVTAANPNGNPPVCQAEIAAESRYADVELTRKVSEELCADDDGKLLVSTDLKSTLEDNEIVKCTKDFYCSWTDFTCTDETSTGSIRVGFKLKQTILLRDKTPISDDVERINTKTTATATMVTTCPSSWVDMDGTCSVCPAGNGVSGSTCSPCALGEYSTGGTMGPCTSCSAGLTTLLTGSKASDDCKAESMVCTVETDVSEHSRVSTLVPPSGARIAHDAYVSMTCGTGYNMALNAAPTFKCSTKPYPVCYPLCSLGKYTNAVLAERFIINNIDKTDLRHNERISITCMSGYEYTENTLVKSHICVNGVLSDFGTCVKQSDSIKVLVIVIACVLALVVIALLIVLHNLRGKKQALYKDKSTGVVENKTAVPEPQIDNINDSNV